MKQYAPYEAPAWKRIWNEEREASEGRKFCRINYDVLINAGMDYSFAYCEYCKICNAPWEVRREKMEQAREAHWKAQAVLWTVCDLVQVPQWVPIQAARIANRYYGTGAMRCLDAERLIKSLL